MSRENNGLRCVICEKELTRSWQKNIFCWSCWETKRDVEACIICDGKIGWNNKNGICRGCKVLSPSHERAGTSCSKCGKYTRKSNSHHQCYECRKVCECGAKKYPTSAKCQPCEHKRYAEGLKEGTIKAPWAGAKKDTKLEKGVEAFLIECGLEYEKQYKVKDRWFDFYIPAKNLLIEADGVYWHSLPHAIENDKYKNKIATDNGYTLVRVPELELDKVWHIQ